MKLAIDKNLVQTKDSATDMFEFVRRFPLENSIRVAVFDFDGTLSLIRSGWVEIMVDLMMSVLRPLPG
ncbi:MAG TPA: hypothetical protein VGM98_10830 [Schlesneria sp.]